MEQETAQLLVAMRVNYGEQFSSKWQGFGPGEMVKLWSRKFQDEGIPAAAVAQLASSISWAMPPSLPELVQELHAIRKAMAATAESTDRLPTWHDPDPAYRIAPLDSQARAAFAAELQRFQTAQARRNRGGA